MIHNIYDHRPHIVLKQVDGSIDCSPVAMYENIVKGTLKITDIEDWEVLMRSIVKAWLNSVE